MCQQLGYVRPTSLSYGGGFKSSRILTQATSLTKVGDILHRGERRAAFGP